MNSIRIQEVVSGQKDALPKTLFETLEAIHFCNIESL